MVLEVGVAPEVDAALGADRHLVPVVVQDDHLAQQGPADRARVLQPVLRVRVGEAVALGAGVVLVQDRAPPLDHPALHVHRAGRCGVHGRDQAGNVVPGPDLVGELQHPHEHGRHPLTPRDLVLLDGGQRRLCVESLHGHHRATQPMCPQAEAQRGGVVQGCR